MHYIKKHIITPINNINKHILYFFLWYIIKSQLKKLLKSQLQIKSYFIYDYIETFLPLDNFFGILLVFASFLQTYCDIYSFHILFFNFFLLQISFCIYLLLVPLFSLCFFDNKLNQYSQRNYIHSFLYTTKKNYIKNL